MKTSSTFRHGLAILALFLMVHRVEAVNFTLTVTAQGSGTVVRNPSNASYPSNVVVTVTATPNAGWYFANWSGDTNGSVNPLNVVVDSSLNITGNFLAFPVYTLTLTTNGQGAIGLSPAGGSYYSNTVITATAAPTAGWVFAGWSGATNSSANPLLFTLNANNSLVGTFAQLPAFDVQPVSVTNGVGANVGFTAHAVGTAPVNYQWYFNSGSLNGATNGTLSLTNVAPTQAGNYQVIATNNYGSATSSVVALVLTNVSGSTNVVYAANQASLVAALNVGGWVGLGFNGTLTLTNTIAISNHVTLDASGVNATISGGGNVRLFTVAPGASFTITNLTLANGLVTNSSSADTPVNGGAICNNGGTVTLVGCTLRNNTVRNEYNNGNGFEGSSTIGGFALGGAIYNNGGTVTLIGTSVSNNVADAGVPEGTASGGGIYTTNGSLTLNGCSLSGNTCNSYQIYAAAGGAVCIISATAYFTNCLFNANNAGGGDTGYYEGGIAIPGAGGAIALLGGNMTVNQCQFLSNVARGGVNEAYEGPGLGGAIYSAAPANIANSTFFGNSAPGGLSGIVANYQGGAIYNSGTMQLNGCCICSNFVSGSTVEMSEVGTYTPGNGYGAGIFNAGQLQATNCTIALNTAQAGLAYETMGANGAAIGAGICNTTNAVTILMNVTLASNLCNAFGSDPSYLPAINGFSAGDQVANLGGTLRLHNTLLAYAGTNGNAYGPITDDGYNISSDGSANLSNNSYNFTDPQLGPLANNGGPTLTMSPLATSPAIDDGDPNTLLHTDQRGLLRPYGAGYDMGAVEYGSIYPAPSPANLSFTRSAPNLLLQFSATPTIVYHLQSSTNLTTWIDVETIGAFSSPSNISRTISPQGGTRLFYRVWY